MEFGQSKFAFNVKSTSARPPKTVEPELQITAGIKGKFKLNEAASKLMGLKPYDYLVFINTEDNVNALKEAYAKGEDWAVAEVEEAGGIDKIKVQWAICKGWAMLDANGQPLTSKKPLTKAEEAALIKAGEVDENGKAIAPDMPAFKGSRLASKMKEVKTGMILEGTDSNNCPELRRDYDEDKHVVYSVSEVPVKYQFPNGNDDNKVDVDLYLINYVREDEKIERDND